MIPAGPSDRRPPEGGVAGGPGSWPARAVRPAATVGVALIAACIGTAAVSNGPTALLVPRAAVLVLLLLAIAAVLGVLAVVVLVLPADDPRRGRLLDGAAVAAALWTVAAAATPVLLYLGEAPPVRSAAFGPGLVSFVSDVAVGRTWLIATVAAAVLTALLVAVRSAPGVALVWVLTAVAAVPIALQSAVPGESIGTERTVVAAGLVQLLAMGTWLGALAAGSAVRAPVRGIPAVGCFLALLVALGAAWPAFAADRTVAPVAICGAVAVGLAGALAVLARGGRVPTFHGTQLLLLALGAGLGVAASVTHGAPATPDRTTPAEILTGAPLPPPPTLPAVLAGWQPDPLWLVVCAALLVGYARLAFRASGRSALRSCSWVAGVLLLGWLTSGAPAVYQGVLLEAHLLQHLALVFVVPLLLAGGAPGRLLASSGARPARRPTAAVLDSRALRTVARPVPAAVLSVAAVCALYGSGALRWSVADPVGIDATACACLLAGSVLVRALTAPSGHRRIAAAVAIALLVAESAGALALATGSSLLLADWFGATGWGTDALAAQRDAAFGAWIVAAAPTVLLLVGVLRSPGTSRSPVARPEGVTA